MITEKDLQEAIAECEGQRNPNASTCIKLAAFYTIRYHMFGTPENEGYSFAPAPQEDKPTVNYNSGTEFSEAVYRLGVENVLPVVDELMTTISVINPRLYASVIRKLDSL